MLFSVHLGVSLAGNNFIGVRSRVRSKCCAQELDLVSVPRPSVEEGQRLSVATPRRISSSLYLEEPHKYDYIPQSEEIHSVVNFIDENGGLSIGSSAGNHASSSYDGTSDTDISGFFSRPVRIDSYTWNESDSVGIKQTILPWHLWATNAYVQNKLNNYAFLRGDLHIKIVINASPFYYGMTQVSYLPLQTLKASTIVNDAATRYFIPYSQRPRLVLDPQHQEAGHLVLPFIWMANFLENPLATDFQAMGQLQYLIYSALQSANGVSGAGITVTTYAWMENIKLSGATVAYAAQSDEYGEGVVSKPASSIASAASYFEKIPVIGPFATATRIGASAVSAIASLFGFTNVPVVSNSVPQRPEPFPKLASSEISYPIEKLTLDPKNELSIDPRIVGMPDGTDEMMITSLACRESYLAKCTWTTANLTDDLLFYSRVNPRLYDADALSNVKVYMTPMCFVSNMFDNWRGDVIFKFKVVASKYHKGRLRLSFDPSKDSTRDLKTITNSANIVHTAIIDIGEVNEVEFRVPYQQWTQFLAIRPTLTSATKGWDVNTAIGTYPFDSFYDNGVVTLRVLNILTAPVASSSVDILIYVRAAENIEFANPTNVDQSHRFSTYAPQSEEYREETTELSTSMGPTKNAVDNQYKMYFGENIRSLRQLLRRYEYHSTNWFDIDSDAADTLRICLKHFYKPPTTPGYISNGTETANEIVGASTYGYNFCQMTNIAYVMNAYLAYRGSINWTFNPLTPGTLVPEMRVSRNNVSGYQASYATVKITTSAKSSAARNVMDLRFSGATAQSITNCNTNAGLNVQCPMYSTFKFQFTDPSYANQGISSDGSILDQFTLEMLIKKPANNDLEPVMVNNYCGIGTDFSLFFFLNVPTYYIYSSVPTGV